MEEVLCILIGGERVEGWDWMCLALWCKVTVIDPVHPGRLVALPHGLICATTRPDGYWLSRMKYLGIGILTGNDDARVGSRGLAGLQAQSNGGTAVGVPEQGSCLAGSEDITTGRVLEGIGSAAGRSERGEERSGQGDESAHDEGVYDNVQEGTLERY